jgi:hypothetical protein
MTLAQSPYSITSYQAQPDLFRQRCQRLVMTNPIVMPDDKLAGVDQREYPLASAFAQILQLDEVTKTGRQGRIIPDAVKIREASNTAGLYFDLAQFMEVMRSVWDRLEAGWETGSSARQEQINACITCGPDDHSCNECDPEEDWTDYEDA